MRECEIMEIGGVKGAEKKNWLMSAFLNPIFCSFSHFVNSDSDNS